MKKMELLKTAFCIALAACLLNACDEGSGYSLNDAWYSVATVNPLSEDAYSLTLDDGTTLWPAATDVPWYKSKHRQRAIAVYTLLSDEFQGYDHAIKLLDIQNILTKAVAKDLGEENDTEYGNDPVEMMNMWLGDGYLNVEFGFGHGGMGVVHYINILRPDSADSPYSFEFRHNAYDDDITYGQKGLVAFDIADILSEIKEDVELTVKINTFDGELVKKILFKPLEEPAAVEPDVRAGGFSSIIK
jgi:hypothetical protein